MKFRLTRHAEWEMARRGIPLELVQRVIDDPEQRVVDESGTGRWIYQSVCHSKMRQCIYCESLWMKMTSRRRLSPFIGQARLLSTGGANETGL